MSDYKNAKCYGYRVGDRFKYKSQAEDVNEIFDINDVLILDRDDGTICPRFENQNGVTAYEYLYLLEKLEDKPLSYDDFVGKTLTVKADGFGFTEDGIGSSWKIKEYSDNGYCGDKGFKVEGNNNIPCVFVGVESFFPDGLTCGSTGSSTKDTLVESIESEEGQREITETVTTSPSTAIQEMLLGCFDDKISVDISMDGVKVKWRDLVFVVDEEVTLEQVLKAVDLLSEQQVEG